MIRATALAALLLLGRGAAAQEPCFECHEAKDSKLSGVHSELGCRDCHDGTKTLPHDEKLPAVDCASCHPDAVKDYAGGAHAAAAFSCPSTRLGHAR